MEFTITSFSGFFYVCCKKTGKLLIEQSFNYFTDAVRAAKQLTTEKN